MRDAEVAITKDSGKKRVQCVVGITASAYLPRLLAAVDVVMGGTHVQLGLLSASGNSHQASLLAPQSQRGLNSAVEVIPKGDWSNQRYATQRNRLSFKFQQDYTRAIIVSGAFRPSQPCAIRSLATEILIPTPNLSYAPGMFIDSPTTSW